MKTVLETNLPDLPKKSGKVRDIYDLGDKLLIVTTDRISAFDHVLPNGIPYKGAVLTSLSAFWFQQLDCCHHYLTHDFQEILGFPGVPREFGEQRETFLGRTMLVSKHKPLPVECIVRGYISGSAWKEYQKTGSVCGVKLPAGLKENFPLPEPIFTPSTKAEQGHDENITLEQMIAILGGTGIDEQLCEDVVEASILNYKIAAARAFDRGIIIADTKFEWSHTKDYTPVLIDEALTPDSSRFWGVENYVLGGSVPSYDKQYVRDYLETTGWDKNSPPPSLPEDIVAKTTEKYLAAHKALTGADLKEFLT